MKAIALGCLFVAAPEDGRTPSASFRLSLFMGCEQRSKADTQGVVVATLAVEPRDAFGGGLGQGQGKQRFFAVWVHGFLLSAFTGPPKADGFFASAAAISSHDGARQRCRTYPEPFAMAPRVLPSG